MHGKLSRTDVSHSRNSSNNNRLDANANYKGTSHGMLLTRKVKKPENHDTGALCSSHRVVIITENYRNLPKTKPQKTNPNPNPNPNPKSNPTTNPNSKP